MPLSGGASVDLRRSVVHGRSRLDPVVSWTFRIAVAMEFIGHGAFGVRGGREAWVPYFGVVGIGPLGAWKLMPLIGWIDVALGLLALLRPMRAALLYMAVWGFWTALLRPLSGETWWELLERAGNYGVPLAFFLWSGFPRAPSEWFDSIPIRSAPPAVQRRVAGILRATIVLLLVGHGGTTAFLDKAVLASQWASLGVHSIGPLPILPVEGWFDDVLGMAVLLHPAAWIFGFVAFWKVACELLWPLTGAPIWEFVERGGSYAAPILLIAISAARRSSHSTEAS